MGTDGDILDEFDDDRLEQAIQRADGDGPWRDAQAQFVDPKVQELLRELQAPPPRLKKSKKRPKRDVPPPSDWQQPAPGGMRAGAPTPTGRPPFGPGDPDLAAFERHLGSETTAAAPTQRSPQPEAQPTAPSPGPRGAAAAPAPAPSAGREITLAVLAAATVFVAVVGSHAAIAGWTADLLWRGLAASALTGFVWHVTDAGRFRSPLIAVGAELLFFASTGRIGETDVRVAIGVGALVAILVAGVLGISREHRFGGGVRH